MSATSSSTLTSGSLLAAFFIVAAIATGGVTWWQFGQSSAKSEISAESQALRQPLSVIVSGDTGGWIVPCGCTANQSGGLLRRGTLVARARLNREVVYADAGGAPGGTSPYQREKFEAILAGELKMGLTAHNLGTPELALGAEYLRNVARKLRVPFVSANVRDENGREIADAYRIISAAGHRVAIVGVVTQEKSPTGLKIGDPKEAVVSVADELRGKCDAIIVLAYLGEVELRAFAASLPEVDAVIGGPTGQSIAPTRVGRSLLASATNKGKFLVQLEAPSGKGPQEWSGRVIDIGPTFDDDMSQQANLAAFYHSLDERDFTAEQSGFAPVLPTTAPKEYRIAGTATCVECHRREHGVWENSTHAHAWDSLKSSSAHVDSYCQQCHTNGFGLPAGFTSRGLSPKMLSVGCESCHGPSQAHARNPQVGTPFVASDQCRRCHDRENSPNFSYTSYWPQIKHGRKTVAPPKETRP